MKHWAAWTGILAGLVLSRLCHVRVLWTDEDYHLAGAIQVLKGSVLYRDFWFDKPPLTPLLHAACGARPGIPLMLASACYLFVGCLLAFEVARRIWGEREGLLAAALLAFYLIFYLPSALIPLAPDLALLVPHLAAIVCLLMGLPVAAGAAAAVGFFFNVKGLLVLAVCLAWRPRWWVRLCAGFALVALGALAALGIAGALGGYWEQVWKWGLAYAGSPQVAHPVRLGLVRVANWLGFHAAITVAAIVFVLRERRAVRRELVMWMAISLAGVCLGLRFAPRYFFQLLPVMAIAGARGAVLAFQARWRLAPVVAALLLLIPVARFGPRYILLAADLATGRPHRWADVALDQDNQEVARLLKKRARPGDSLLVWGYSPGIYVYTRMRAGAPFMDSQPLTGVSAERHFDVYQPITPEWARANRVELTRWAPTFVVDSIGPANPHLAMTQYPELTS